MENDTFQKPENESIFSQKYFQILTLAPFQMDSNPL